MCAEPFNKDVVTGVEVQQAMGMSSLSEGNGVRNIGTTTRHPSRTSTSARSASQSGRPVPTARGIYHPRVSTLHTGAKCLRNKPAARCETIGDMASDAGGADL
jgi:hypothetical protein